MPKLSKDNRKEALRIANEIDWRVSALLEIASEWADSLDPDKHEDDHADATSAIDQLEQAMECLSEALRKMGGAV